MIVCRTKFVNVWTNFGNLIENFNKNLEKFNEKLKFFSTIDSRSLRSKKFVLGGTFTRFPLELLLYMLLQKFRGARRMIELFFKLGGCNAPPALPVADPMLTYECDERM